MATAIYNIPASDSFVSYLTGLLAVYDLGPQTSIPPYDGPTDLRTDAILKSLSSMARRMWTAENALEKHNVYLPKKTEIAAFFPAYGGPHSQGEDQSISSDAEAHEDKAHCPTCHCGEDSSDPSAVEELKVLKAQVQDVTRVCSAVASGDLSQTITVPIQGVVMVQLTGVVNTMVVRFRTLTAEVKRVSLEAGSQGKLGGQAHVPDLEGDWLNLVRDVNRMSSSLADQARSIAHVTTAITRGDFKQKIEMEMEGEMSALKGTVNSIVDQLSAFASDVTTSSEVGLTHGVLGGQARVEAAQGTWADLTRNINKMASSSTHLVRSLSEVVKAASLGVLDKQLDVDVQGEMLDLKVAVNFMLNQLNTLACEVNRVSMEVHMGVMGGQAVVPDAQGMWKVLVDNVNLMSLNLANRVHSVDNEVRKVGVAGR